jgi:hypothetical protein
VTHCLLIVEWEQLMWCINRVMQAACVSNNRHSSEAACATVSVLGVLSSPGEMSPMTEFLPSQFLLGVILRSRPSVLS